MKEALTSKSSEERSLRHQILEFRHRVSDLDSKVRWWENAAVEIASAALHTTTSSSSSSSATAAASATTTATTTTHRRGKRIIPSRGRKAITDDGREVEEDEEEERDHTLGGETGSEVEDRLGMVARAVIEGAGLHRRRPTGGKGGEGGRGGGGGGGRDKAKAK